MPELAGGVMPGEQVADAQGPSASLQYGDRSRMDRLADSLKNEAPGAYAATQPPGAVAPSGGAPVSLPTLPGAPGGAQPPVQSPPLSANDLRPGGPVFMQPQTQPRLPWQEQVRAWAAHPQAGPFTAILAQRLTAAQPTPQQPAQPPKQ